MKRQNLYNKEQNLYNETLSLQTRKTSTHQSLKSIDQPPQHQHKDSEDSNYIFNCYRDVLIAFL